MCLTKWLQEFVSLINILDSKDGQLRLREIKEYQLTLSRVHKSAEQSVRRILDGLHEVGRLPFEADNLHPDLLMHLGAVAAVKLYWRQLGKPPELIRPVAMFRNLMRRMASLNGPEDLDGVGFRLFTRVTDVISSRLVNSGGELEISEIAVKATVFDDGAIAAIAQILWNKRDQVIYEEVSGEEVTR